MQDDWTAQGAFMAWRYVQRAAQERFIAWPRRQQMIAELDAEPIRGTEWGFRQLLYSQGAGRPFHWRGVPCFKSVYDLAIYAMLVQELRPGTIVELGSGTGGSALFLADLCTSAGLATRIASIDTAAVDNHISDPRIAFVRADCSEWLQTAAGSKREFPGPCLMIEDFHGDLSGVFAHMDAILEAGDYLVIEDSNPKQSRIAEVIAGRPYLIDSRYTDFFGINCTSAINSIFIKDANAGLTPP
jgi:cephalosporin hydroxylase